MIGAWFLAALPGPGLGVAPPPTLPLAQEAAGLGAVWESAFGLQVVDGVPLAGGPGYKARFFPGGFELTPALGEAAPRSFPLSFSLASIRRGEAVLVEGPPKGAELEAEGNVVRYARGGGVVETVEVRREGLEHSFRFDSLPEGSGDLVVRGRIDTDLVRPEVPGSTDELSFEAPGLGGVRIGAVTGIDAEGRRAAGWLRFDGTHVEYGLPASFVETASLPLVLDPPIGTASTLFVGGSDPDVAYDETTGNYLVVWEVAISATDYDVRGQRVSAAGATVGGLISVTVGPDAETDPAVANVRDADRFLVAYKRGGSTPAAPTDDILARAVAAWDGSVGAAAAVADSSLVDEVEPDVGGGGPTELALVVWKEASGPVRQRLVLVPAPPYLNDWVYPQGPSVVVTSDPASANAAVAKNGTGIAAQWLLAWDAPLGSVRRVYARAVFADGTFLTPSTLVSPGALIGNQTDPDCDATDGFEFLVVWEQEEAPGATAPTHDLFCREMRLQYDPVMPSLVPITSPVALAATSGVEELDPAVAYTGEPSPFNPPGSTSGEAYLVVWRKLAGAAPFVNYDILARAVEQGGACLPCEPEAVVSSFLDNEFNPEVAAQRGGGMGAGEEALVVWQANSILTLTASVRAQRYEPDSGTVTNLGGGSMDLFSPHSFLTCPGLGGSGFHRFVLAPPSWPVFLVISFGPASNYACGSCVIGPDPAASFFFGTVTDLAGRALIATPIPSLPSLVGVQFIEQWVIPGVGGGCCPDYGFHFSHTLQVTIGV
jgi:hypothetical protein